jgi:hypothetical protein
METETDSETLETASHPCPFLRAKPFREIARIVEAYLHQLEAVVDREFRQILEIAATLGIGKTQALESRRSIGEVQVLRSFFLAAGKRTLFNISR